MENKEIITRMIALDLLLTTKLAMQNSASALMEAATPEVREVFSNQFQTAADFHAMLADLAAQRGWYDAYDMETQMRHDARLAQWVYQMS